MAIILDPEEKKIYKEKDNYKMPLLNIVIRILAVSKDQQKLLIQLGERQVLIESKQISNINRLVELIAPNAYHGSKKDIEEIKEVLLLDHKEAGGYELVDLQEVIGRHTDGKINLWILNNKVLIEDNKKWREIAYEGQTSIIVQNKIYWIDTTKVSPSLKLHTLPRQQEDLTLQELIEKWESVYNCKTILRATLGYFIACMYMPEAMKAAERRNFPIMALFGTTAQGKTSLTDLLYKFWGVNSSSSPYTQTSPFVETKQVCAVGCFPIWRDEYRNIGHAPAKENILRSLYDRTQIEKGTAGQELLNYTPKTTLFLTGEDVMNDPAVRRRFVVFQLSESYKLPQKAWLDALIEGEEIFSNLFFKVLEKGFDQEVCKKLLKETLVSDNSEREEKFLYAVLGAVVGEDYGRKVIVEASAYWKENNLLGGESLTTQIDQVENFFLYVHNTAISQDWYKAQPSYGTRKAPKIFKYINKSLEGTERIYLWGLITEMWRYGYEKETNLGKKALRSAIKTMLNAESKTIRFDEIAAKGYEFKRWPGMPPNLTLLLDETATAVTREIEAQAEIENAKRARSKGQFESW